MSYRYKYRPLNLLFTILCLNPIRLTISIPCQDQAPGLAKRKTYAERGKAISQTKSLGLRDSNRDAGCVA
jgi:hypothetical protein